MISLCLREGAEGREARNMFPVSRLKFCRGDARTGNDALPLQIQVKC